jgi:ACR3 family arsenite efflux pump ArsB
MSSQTSAKLVRLQVPLYLAAVAVAAALGIAAPGIGSALEGALYPALAFLLYTMFLHIPLVDVGRALGERRFLAAVLVTNFAALPPMVFAMTRLLPDDQTLLPCCSSSSSRAPTGRSPSPASAEAARGGWSPPLPSC